MLSTAKKYDLAVDVAPGFREESGNDICYVEAIYPKFHQGNEVTFAWSATSILIHLMRSDTTDKMVQLRNTYPDFF